MFKYTLAVTSPEYWNTIHNALIVDSNEDGIPDRKVTCSDPKEHSPTRGTYWLTEEEATGISTHPNVKWIELSPSEYPHLYPHPELDSKRFGKNVKVYRDLDLNAPPTTPTSAEENRTNWGMRRVGITTNGDSWPNITGNPAVINTDLDYSLTGKNVDIIIQDSGCLQYHPEFIDDDGKSRVRDVILDGPYYIDPTYFNNNNYTYTKPDGRTGITTASAHSWWENSSNRSNSFQSIGVIAIPNNYTETNALGIGGTSHSMTSSHGTACASLSAGKNFGLAFEANIWSVSIFSPADINTELCYDAIKLFHQNKPINTATGKKNPTVVNGSWGYYGGFNSNTNVSYSFAGSTGSFTGYNSGSTGVQALAYGLSSSQFYSRQFATSSRTSSLDTAGNEMSDAGVIFVASAGNQNQRLGIGLTDSHLNDYLTALNGGESRPGYPGETAVSAAPSGHRNWIHPQNIGYDNVEDFHPTICVGAMDEFIDSGYQERKASYSNNGPGVDIWAPAYELIAAGARAANGDQLGTETNYARYNSEFVDRYFNGTSAAAPVVTGVVALFLESKPDATSAEVKDYLKVHASQMLPSSQWIDAYPNSTSADYWRQNYNNRGAANRVLFDPTASDARPAFANVSGGESITTSGLILNLDGNNYTSGSTWTDLSGEGNDGTIDGATYISGYGGHFDFDGTNDNIQVPMTGDVNDTLFNGSNNFSLEFWFKADNLPAGGASDFKLSQALLGGGNRQIIIVFGNGFDDKEVGVRVNMGSWTGPVGSGVDSIDNNIWYNVIITYDSSSGFVLYLNGDQKSTSSTTGTIGTPSSPFDSNNKLIGCVKDDTGNVNFRDRFFDGKISICRIYNKVLTATEVIHNFDAMKGRFESKPLIVSGVSYTLS